MIVGPKWCGKSTTANRYAKTVIDLMPLESRNEFIELAKISPIEPKLIVSDLDGCLLDGEAKLPDNFAVLFNGKNIYDRILPYTIGSNTESSVTKTIIELMDLQH